MEKLTERQLANNIADYVYWDDMWNTNADNKNAEN